MDFSKEHFLLQDFTFSSLQVVFNAEVARHCDKNDGWSVSVALGVFSGGMFEYGDAVVDTRHAPVHYNGAIPHGVREHHGNLFSLTVFLLNSWHELKDNDRASLGKLGFRLPNPETREFPPKPIGTSKTAIRAQRTSKGVTREVFQEDQSKVCDKAQRGRLHQVPKNVGRIFVDVGTSSPSSAGWLRRELRWCGLYLSPWAVWEGRWLSLGRSNKSQK